jgi:asparagine synthase (glutamine-hydrolysing)
MLNGHHIKQNLLDDMRTALQFTQPNKEALWQNEKAALGSLIRFDTPESFKEQQPIFFEDDRKVMVVNARIDNRDELCGIFGISLIHRDNHPDSYYVKIAFEKWGIEATEHLIGDWSFAVYDKPSQKLWVARDHCGIMACYYYACNEFFAFSSSPKALLALKEIPKELNEFRLAQILVAWPGDGEQTCYQNIFNLLPGHYLTLDNAKPVKTKFWELTEQPDLILPNEQDYYDRFLEIFTEAVKCRLRTTKQVGISLSGGLDSTSVAAIAAIELAKQNKELFAFTSVPLYKDYKVPPGRNGDEGELAGLMAKKYPNIRHFLVNAEGYDPIECIKKAVDIFDEPMHAAANQYWIQAINDKAKEYDCNILLNGQGGNGTISWPTAKVKLYNQKGIKYYKHRLRLAYDSMHDFFFDHQVYKYPFLKYSDINPEFAERLDLMKKMKEAGHDPRFRKVLGFKEAQRKLTSQAHKNGYTLLYRKSIWYGINSFDPTGDKSLLSFTCSWTKSLFQKNGFDRIMVKRGMQSFLPLEIINSQQSGLQACDIAGRSKDWSLNFLLTSNNFQLLSIFRKPQRVENNKYEKYSRNLSTSFLLTGKK